MNRHVGIRRNGLIGRLTGITCTITVLMVLLIATAGYSAVNGLIERREEASTRTQLIQAEHNIDALLKQIDTAMRQLVVHESIRDFLEEPSNKAADTTIGAIQAANALNKIRSFYPDVGMMAIDAGDRYLCVSENSTYYTNHWNESMPEMYGGFFDKTEDLGKFHIGNVPSSCLSPGTRQHDVCITVAYALKNGCLLMIALPQQIIANLFNFLSSDQLYIADEKGRIIVDASGKRLGTVSHIFSVPLENYGSFRKENQLGISQQIIYRRMEANQWTLVREIPYSEYRGDVLHVVLRMIVIIAVAIALFCLIAALILRSMLRPMEELADTMDRMGEGELGILIDHMPNNEIGVLVRKFNTMSQYIADLIQRIRDTERERREIEQQALRAQINPHFIFNTITVIEYMAQMAGAANVSTCLTAFNNLLHPLFVFGAKDCTLRDEIQFLDNYIIILNARFGRLFNIRFDIPEELLDARIMRFILQPLIENAVIHGRPEKLIYFAVNVRAYAEDCHLMLEVSNNGRPVPAEKLNELRDELDNARGDQQLRSGGQVGLINIQRRLALRFGENGALTIHSGESKTCICVRLPLSKRTDDL